MLDGSIVQIGHPHVEKRGNSWTKDENRDDKGKEGIRRL